MKQKIMIILTALILLSVNLFFATPHQDDDCRDISIIKPNDAYEPNVGHELFLDDVHTRSNNGYLYRNRAAGRVDVETLKEIVGIWQPGVDYNPKFDGFGTGLKPPRESEWEEMIGSAGLVTDVIALEGTRANVTSLDMMTEKYFPPIGSQGYEASCTAWSTTYYHKTYIEAREHDWDLSGASWVGGHTGQPTPINYQDKIMSPEFVYHQINEGEDGGSWMDDAYNLMAKVGTSSWEKMPYSCYDHTSWPTEEAWREAPLYRGDETIGVSEGWNWLWVENETGVENLRNLLISRIPVSISIDAGQFNTLGQMNDTWTLDTYGNPNRNHAQTVVGFDDERWYDENGSATQGAFKIVNSWGPGRQDSVYWISYESFKRDVNYVGFMYDKVNYNPETLAVFQISHSKRGECNISFGVGNISNPNGTKNYKVEHFDGGPVPFPNHVMAVDITEFKNNVTEINGSHFFLNVTDIETGTTGSIQSFWVEHYTDYINNSLYVGAPSDDPVVNTIQNTPVYAELDLVDDAAPEADAGEDQTIENNTMVQFDGTGSFDYSGITNYTWDFIYDGNPITLYGPDPQFQFNMYGSFLVNLNVTDPWNHWDMDNLTVFVEDITPPSADAGEDQWVEPGDLVTFDGSGSSDNVAVGNYTWTFTYDGNPQTLYEAGPSFQFDLPGIYTVTVVVEDTSTNTDTDTVTVWVNDSVLPAADAGIDQLVDQWDLVNFDGSGSSDNVGIASYEWTFNDGGGQTLNGVMPVYDFNNAGFFAVTLNITDLFGNWDEDVVNITVLDIELPQFGSEWHDDLETENPALLSINITDNVDVDKVFLNLSWNNGTWFSYPVTNYTLDSWEITLMPPMNATTLEYFFRANDTSDNWNISTATLIGVSDHTSPDFGQFWHGPLTTGESFLLSINITDNIGIDTVTLNISLDGGTVMSWQVANNTNDSWTIIINLPENALTVDCIFIAQDISGNKNTSAQQNFLVIDNDNPVFGGSWHSVPTTGDVAHFSVNITDNIDVDIVAFEFTYDNNTYQTWPVTNNTGPSYEISIMIYPGAQFINFRFWVNDTSNNALYQAHTYLLVADNDLPIFSGLSYSPPTTGDNWVLGVTVSDNVVLDSLLLFFTLDGNDQKVWDINNETQPDVWRITVSIPWNSTHLEFYIRAEDSTGNMNQSQNVSLGVLDNDVPLMTSLSFLPLTTGDITNFSIDIVDNILIDAVMFNFSFNNDSGHTWQVLNSTMDTWSIEISIPDDGEYMEYQFWVNDTSGNGNQTPLAGSFILDNDAPMADAGEDVIIDQHQHALLQSIGSTDNIGISNLTWSFMYDGLTRFVYGNDSSYLFDISGSYVIWLNVTDGSGNWDMDNLTLLVMDITPPTVTAGIDIQIDQHELVELNASACSDNGVISSYVWTITRNTVRGNFVRDADPVILLGRITHFVFHDAGAFTVNLTITDQEGNSASDNFYAEVRDTTAPAAWAGPDMIVDEGTTIELDGTLSTDNVAISNYTWQIHHPLEIRTLYYTMIPFLFTYVGEYNITLNVSDEMGNWDTDMMTVIVNDISYPVAHAGENIAVDQGEQFVLNASESSDNYNIVNYTWTVAGKSYYEPVVEISITDPGVYTAHLRVKDEVGHSSDDTIIITVLDITPPVARITLEEIVYPEDKVIVIEMGHIQEIHFDGLKSSDNVGIVNFTWSIENLTLYSSKLTWSLNSSGLIRIDLLVFDLRGNKANATLFVDVVDFIRPVADGGPDRQAYTGETIKLNATASYDNQEIVEYVWSFWYQGEQVILEGPIHELSFDQEGDYLITLNVTDSFGNHMSDNVKVTVKEEPESPSTPGDDDSDINTDDSSSDSLSDHCWFIGVIVLIILIIIILVIVMINRRKKEVDIHEKSSEDEDDSGDENDEVLEELLSDGKDEGIGKDGDSAEESYLDDEEDYYLQEDEYLDDEYDEGIVVDFDEEYGDDGFDSDSDDDIEGEESDIFGYDDEDDSEDEGDNYYGRDDAEDITEDSFDRSYLNDGFDSEIEDAGLDDDGEDSADMSWDDSGSEDNEEIDAGFAYSSSSEGGSGRYANYPGVEIEFDDSRYVAADEEGLELSYECPGCGSMVNFGGAECPYCGSGFN